MLLFVVLFPLFARKIFAFPLFPLSFVPQRLKLCALLRSIISFSACIDGWQYGTAALGGPSWLTSDAAPSRRE
jgi:hypothetical protein